MAQQQADKTTAKKKGGVGARVRRGDVVQVMAGKYKGKRGKVLRVLVERERVVVEGVAIQRPQNKPNSDPKRPEGHIGEKLGHIAISNVMPIDPGTNKPTRVRFVSGSDGRKARVGMSGSEISSVLS